MGGAPTQIVRSQIRQSKFLNRPFDRRLGLATLIVDTAGRLHRRGPQISNLPLDEARAVAGALAHERRRPGMSRSKIED